MLGGVRIKSHYAYCYADCRISSRLAECDYAECRHAECRGALLNLCLNIYQGPFVIWVQCYKTFHLGYYHSKLAIRNDIQFEEHDL